MAARKCKIEIDLAANTVLCTTHAYHYREYIVGLDARDMTNILLDHYNAHRAKKIAEQEQA